MTTPSPKQGSGEATARPWSTVLGDYGSLPTNNYLAVYGADGSCVAYVLAHKAFWERGDRDHPVEANARLIVTAVNAFDDLVAALRAVKQQTYCDCPQPDGVHTAHEPGCFIPLLQHALSKATAHPTDNRE